MKRLILTTALFSSFVQAAATPLTFGGFLDTYYAYDFNQPKNREREYTTQPVRHNEFNVNLAYVEALLKNEKTRGRLALQYGHSVTKNTLGEPNDGQTSGAQDSKAFQEAYVGKRFDERTWIDFGIFLGNIGAESWVSKDNWTYSRALSLDYVPYYSSGIRIERTIDEKQSLQLQILNGWQNMSENNSGKALGLQFRRTLAEKFIFTYNSFFGDEEVVSRSPRFRGYHNFIIQWSGNEKRQSLTTFDFGHQSQQENKGVDGWIAMAQTFRFVLNKEQALATRIEYYSDPHEANVATMTKNGFRVYSASVNFDLSLDDTSLWRTELRGYVSEDRIYPSVGNSKSRTDGLIVSSFSIWF